METGQNHNYIKRFNSLFRKIHAALSSFGFSASDVWIDEDALALAVRDYFDDIDRLKDYSKIERVSTSKIYGYQTYWLLRRSPIQISNNAHGEKFRYINEIVFSMMMISDMCSEVGMQEDHGNNALKRYFDLLYYSFRFRNVSQQSLELAIESFYLGHSTT